MSQFDADILVVGLGPVGATMAALARIYGLSVIAIDRAAKPYPLPRAAVIDQEIMRIFQAIGAAERIEETSIALDRYHFINAAGEVLLEFPILAEGKFGWAETYAVHQPTLEAILRDRLTALDVGVHLSVELADFTHDDAGVTARLVSEAGRYTVRTRYLVGCDGASSLVRERSGFTLDDLGFDEPWLVIDTIGPVGGKMPTPCQICDPRRPITHLPLAGGRLRWEFMLRPGEDPASFGDPENVRSLLAPFDYAAEHIIERQAIYRFHALVARQWRTGRVFLAGDAVHQMPPFAGQGMCSGIRDAMNLAWKLAAVEQEGADPVLLDSYQQERAPHVRAVVETAVEMGRVVCLLDETAAAERDAAMLASRARGDQQVSTTYPDLSGDFFTRTAGAGALFPQWIVDGIRLDTVLGAGPVLISNRSSALNDAHLRAMDVHDRTLAPFAERMTAWLAALGTDAVLIRPDRHIFGTGDPRWLREEWSARTRRRIAA